MKSTVAAAPGAERLTRDLLALADIQVNGSRPSDIRVHDSRFFSRLLSQGSLGLGESYMDGWWDCEDLRGFVFRATRAGLREKAPRNLSMLLQVMKAHTLNLQTKQGSRTVAKRHYDLGNDLFQAFLDPWMQYSCGYFAGTDDLIRSQEQKLDLIARKLQITSSDHLLDIGCGWGGLAKYVAERYGCRVTGVNISQGQIQFARGWCTGLPVDILLCDYREVRGTFTKIVCVGMFEHVGPKNYRTFVEVVRRILADDGLFLLHTIGGAYADSPDPWMSKYIFPNSYIPSMQQLAAAFDKLLVVEDWHNFSTYYDKTCMHWHRNFLRNWPQLEGTYGERFRRMWEYYLTCCAGSFQARTAQLYQIVLSKEGVLGGYTSVR